MAIIKLQGENEKKIGAYYQLDSNDDPIGIGGMGQVYKGVCVNEKTGTTRPVAIKFMYDDLDTQTIEKGRREASVQLHNDNLLEMIGFLETEEQNALGSVVKHYHVISELLEGITLQEIIDGNVPETDEDNGFGMSLYNDYRYKRLEFSKRVIKAVLSGVLAMHDAGYIHRDIDPSNIMLTTDGHIKLIDFGIAKQMTSLTNNDRSFTTTGKFIGKAKYAAPEQVTGDIAHQNKTTDIYSIGILFYQLVCGHLPFNGPDHEVMQMQINKGLPLKEIQDKTIRNIIKRATEKNQQKRFQSASEFRVALDNPSKSRKAPASFTVIITIMAILGIALGVLLGFLL